MYFVAVVVLLVLFIGNFGVAMLGRSPVQNYIRCGGVRGDETTSRNYKQRFTIETPKDVLKMYNNLKL